MLLCDEDDLYFWYCTVHVGTHASTGCAQCMIASQVSATSPRVYAFAAPAIFGGVPCTLSTAAGHDSHGA
jgi:hypothetical protein